jgi:RNA polymerase sigma factor (sigma-70 family)
MAQLPFGRPFGDAAEVEWLARELERRERPHPGDPSRRALALEQRARAKVTGEVARGAVGQDISGGRLPPVDLAVLAAGFPELSSATGLALEQVDRLIAIERMSRGLEEPLTDEEGAAGTFGDFVADPVAEDEYERVLDRMQVEQLRDLTRVLDDRERRILYAHYGLGSTPQPTLREIADGLVVSAERVRHIEERALEKLRSAAAWPDAPRS